MFTKFLKSISSKNVVLLKPLMKNNIMQNPVIFGYSKIPDLKDYRYIYLGNLYAQKSKLQKVFNRIERNKSKLEISQYEILKKEIKFIYRKIDFLKNVYDFEANKIDSKYKISYPEFDYDYYNKIFFGVTKSDILKDIVISEQEEYNQFITKNQLIELLKFSVEKIPGLKYKFGAYAFMSHSSGVLVIPNKKLYSNRELVTLFFHEMTHFFRRYNNIRNFGTNYGFSDYMKIEEGFALYNEYKYGEKLITGLKYNAYYDACYNVLLNKKYNQKQRIEHIYKILNVKGFSREKSLHYYYRFHRYTSLGAKQFFLKDLVYTKGYELVNKKININSKYYDIFFSGRIGMSLIKAKLYNTQNNFDTKNYFESILIEIQKKIGN
ncbi:MAG: DUF1704 domain-containing protein [Candidatus Gracilibacteria bacterium]|nr:DUF1704 domain-containing protein [Candidatus Gracilibacteria bacterium]